MNHSTANKQIIDKISEYISKNSRLEPKRNYVGLSRIGNCPLSIYNEYFNGIKMDDGDYRNAYRGYLMEDDMRNMLLNIKFIKPGTPPAIILPPEKYNGIRVEGHIDDVAINGAGVELKSVSKEKFDTILKEERVFMTMFSQAQAYMKYGGYKYFYFVIRCTETFRHHVHSCIPLVKVQNSIEDKLQMVCECIHRQTPPECKCLRCN